MRDYRFMAQLPTRYLQHALTMCEYTGQEKTVIRAVLAQRNAPFKLKPRRKPGQRQSRPLQRQT